MADAGRLADAEGSRPEPDVALVDASAQRRDAHPTTALLVDEVEVTERVSPAERELGARAQLLAE